MDTHHIRYFLAVCETLNFTRAAQKCNVTQPALSRAIQQLEDEVGAPLFRRERNLTHLTDSALLLRPRLQEVADGLGDAKRDAQRFLTMDEASVTLGIMCTVGPRRFTGLLANFQATQSDISLQLVEGVPQMLIERLEQGEIDIAIMASPDGFPEALEAMPLYREQFMVAFPAGHRFAGLDAIPMAAVDGENYLDRVNCEYTHRDRRRDAGVRLLGEGRLSKRARRLDPEHGGGRTRHLLSSRIQRGRSRRSDKTCRRTGDLARDLPRLAEGSRAFARPSSALQPQREITLGFRKNVCTRINFRHLWKAGLNFLAAARV